MHQTKSDSYDKRHQDLPLAVSRTLLGPHSYGSLILKL